MFSNDGQLPFFVYGTLRPQEVNYYLFEGQILGEESAVIRGFQLYSMGAYPMIIRVETEQNPIQGNLIRPTPEAYTQIQERLDQLEEYDPHNPNSPYQRVAEPVYLNTGETRLAWVYVGNPTFLQSNWHRLIPNGDWVNYRQIHTVPHFVGLEG